MVRDVEGTQRQEHQDSGQETSAWQQAVVRNTEQETDQDTDQDTDGERLQQERCTASDNSRPSTDNGLLPVLDRGERQQVAQRASISAAVVHETVREEGERELARHPSALAWSGLAAGPSMGFSLTAQGLIRAAIPDASWRPLVSSFGYSLGFLIVVLGRQQLFTENTLTVMLPLLARPSPRLLLRVVRLWSIVLLANLVGAFIFATVAAHSLVFAPNAQRAFVAIGQDSITAASVRSSCAASSRVGSSL